METPKALALVVYPIRPQADWSESPVSVSLRDAYEAGIAYERTARAAALRAIVASWRDDTERRMLTAHVADIERSLARSP